MTTKESFQHTENIRQKLNYEIVNELYTLIEQYPTLRFGQIIAKFLPSAREGQKMIPPTCTAQDWISTIQGEEPAQVLARYLKNSGL